MRDTHEKDYDEWTQDAIADLRAMRSVLLLVADCRSTDDWRDVADFLGRRLWNIAEEAEEWNLPQSFGEEGAMLAEAPAASEEAGAPFWMKEGRDAAEIETPE